MASKMLERCLDFPPGGMIYRPGGEIEGQSAEEPQEHGPKFMPVEGASLRGSVKDLVAELDMVQCFRNLEQVPIEVSFVFPVDKASSVSAFAVEVGGRVLKGAVEEKEQAAEKYEDAIASGQKAFLFEKKDEFSYTVNIGRLDVDERVNVKVSFVKELQADSTNNTISLIIPKGLLPPLRGGGETEEVCLLETAFGTVLQGDVDVKLEADMPSPVTNVTSANHHPEFQVNANKVDISLKGLQQGFAADLVVHFQVEKLAMPIVTLEKDPDNADPLHEFAACISLIPGSDANILDKMNTELIFVMDCSGSMAGGRIRECKRAMQIFLQSLDEDVYFNVVRFGSSFEMLWPQSSPVTEENLSLAKDYVNSSDADLGGTNLCPVLQMLFSKEHLEGRSRQMFILTDGEVLNTRECISEVSKNVGNTRVFTIGLGNEVDAELVIEMARKGNGKSSFVQSGENELLTSTVIAQLGSAMKPALTDCKVEIRDSSNPDGIVVCRQHIPPTFVGDTQNVYAFFRGDAAPYEIFLSARCGEEVIEESIEVDTTFHRVGKMVHVMAAKQRIADIEDNNLPGLKNEVIRLAVQYNLGSGSTSFVVVDDTPQEAQEMAPELRQVDISLQLGYTTKSLDPSVDAPSFGAPEPEVDFEDFVQALGGEFVDPDLLADLRQQAQAMRNVAAEPQEVEEDAFVGFGVERMMARACGAPRRRQAKGQMDRFEAEPVMAMAGCMRMPESMGISSSDEDEYGDADMAFLPPPPPPPQPSRGFELQSKRADIPTKPAVSPDGSLESLLLSQKVNGAWEDADILAAVLKCEASMLEEKGDIDVSLTVWLTALGVAILEIVFPQHGPEWQLIHRKALRFMNREFPGGEATEALALAKETVTRLHGQ